MNTAAVGKVYPDVPFAVDPERVRAFRAVFDEPRGVPATFATAAEFIGRASYPTPRMWCPSDGGHANIPPWGYSNPTPGMPTMLQ